MTESRPKKGYKEFKMDSNITKNNMLNTPTAAMFAFWLNSLPSDSAAKLFGENPATVLQAARDFQLANPVDMQQSLLEIPLLGTAYADISFSYNLDNLHNNFFTSVIGQKILPLFQYLQMLLPEDNSVFVELDTGNGKQEIPAVFFDCTDCTETIFSKLWAKGSEPPQWEKAKEIVSNLPQDWQLLYLGLMPGRPDSPLKLIFTKITVGDRHLPCSTNDMETLLKSIQHSPLTKSMTKKLQYLIDLDFTEITVSLNLMPDNQYDSRMGFEVFVPTEGTNPEETLETERGQKLLKALTNWQMADERVNLLQECCDIFFPPQTINCAETQIQAFLNHVKLQWDEEKPLPAKAYIACNSYFR